MKNLNFFLINFIVLVILTGCQTIKQKTDAIVEKENKKLSAFIGKSSQDLKISLGSHR